MAMQIRDTLRLALGALSAHKMRTALIVVGEQRAAAPVAVLGAEVAEKLFVDRSPARDPTVQLTGTPVTAGPQ